MSVRSNYWSKRRNRFLRCKQIRENYAFDSQTHNKTQSDVSKQTWQQLASTAKVHTAVASINHHSTHSSSSTHQRSKEGCFSEQLRQHAATLLIGRRLLLGAWVLVGSRHFVKSKWGAIGKIRRKARLRRLANVSAVPEKHSLHIYLVSAFYDACSIGFKTPPNSPTQVNSCQQM